MTPDRLFSFKAGLARANRLSFVIFGSFVVTNRPHYSRKNQNRKTQYSLFVTLIDDLLDYHRHILCEHGIAFLSQMHAIRLNHVGRYAFVSLTIPDG